MQRLRNTAVLGRRRSAHGCLRWWRIFLPCCMFRLLCCFI